MNEPEFVETKPNKVKIVLSILASTLVVATISTLLIGHFKFDWFKSDEYKIDAHINRSIYQANYFSEKKTINTKFTFDGHSEEKEYIVDNDFVVFLTGKKENLNTAALVLLSATGTVDDEIHELAHLNMFDEEQVKLPNNMDEYNAESIIELINKVIPKLTRSKKEDISNGLEITSKKVNNKRTIIQSEAPKQFEEFKGSRFTKMIKTEIENDQVTNIESNDNLHMESQPEGDEMMYGPKDFYYNVKSEITSMQVNFNEKENIDLVNKLAEKFTFVESEVLLQLITNKKLQENKDEIVEEEPEIQPVRSLFSISASRSFPIASFNVLGQTVSVKYEVGISGGKAYNRIVISSKLGSFQFGTGGYSGTFNWSKSYSQTIFKFIVPPPFSFIQIGCYVKGSVSVGLGLKGGNGQSAKYWAKASGSLALGAEVTAGFGKIASLSAYAEGTVISANAQVTISKGSVSKDSGFRLTVGRLEVGVRGSLVGFTKTLWSKTLYNGYTLH